jgi:predicted nuclease of predicted toxin-antitoxin system
LAGVEARFLLDEDLNPTAAEVARGLGLDAVSVHEIERLGLSDEEQLRFAAAEAEGRILLTRNRDDFLALTTEFYRRGAPHRGVLIVTAGLPNNRPERLAHALARWKMERGDHLHTTTHYADFLSPQPPA